VKRLLSKKWWVVIGILAMLFLTVVLLVAVSSGPRPECHRAFDGAFQEWMQVSHTNIYPNLDGVGSNSLAVIEQYFGPDIQRYEYIPGLKCEDPKDLVLMYLKTKTHYSWHGDAKHTIFSPERWMVLSPDIIGYETSNSCPEGGQLLDTPEFKRRIQMTVAFLKEYQRPNWQAVAKEQSDFLNSIKE
jgi:hypothetical protein